MPLEAGILRFVVRKPVGAAILIRHERPGWGKSRSPGITKGETEPGGVGEETPAGMLVVGWIRTRTRFIRNPQIFGRIGNSEPLTEEASAFIN